MMRINRLHQIIKPFQGRDIFTLSAALSYSTALSLIPYLTLTFFSFHFLGGTEVAAERLRPLILTFLTVGAGENLLRGLTDALQNAKVEQIGVFGFFALLAISIRLVGDVDTAIQRIWKAPSLKISFKRNLLYLFVVLVAIPFSALLFGIVLLNVAKTNLPDLSWFLIGSFALLAAVLRWTPPKRPAFFNVFVGSALTVVGWYLTAIIYSWANKVFFSENTLYGSLAFIPLFLFWIFLLWFIFLIGASLVNTMEVVHFRGRFNHAIKTHLKSSKAFLKKRLLPIRNA